VTERATDPSGAMGAIQRMMANDVACKNVAMDFATAPGERRLFRRSNRT
jgi:DNA-binding FrmR family transcriptional regulator